MSCFLDNCFLKSLFFVFLIIFLIFFRLVNFLVKMFCFWMQVIEWVGMVVVKDKDFVLNV